MLKAIFGLFLLVFFYKFIMWVLRDAKETTKEEKANSKITEKRGILKSFARKHKEIDLDEELVDEAQKLQKRVDEVNDKRTGKS